MGRWQGGRFFGSLSARLAGDVYRSSDDLVRPLRSTGARSCHSIMPVLISHTHELADIVDVSQLREKRQGSER